jgi:hypothetical protein
MQDARRRLSRLYSQQAALAKASALVQDRAADQEMAAADSRESLVGCVGVWVLLRAGGVVLAHLTKATACAPHAHAHERTSAHRHKC